MSSNVQWLHCAGRFCAQTGPTGSGLKTDHIEDQAGLSALATVVRQCPANAGQHTACRFRVKTGPTRSGLKTDHNEDKAGLSALATVVRQSPAGNTGWHSAVCISPGTGQPVSPSTGWVSVRCRPGGPPSTCRVSALLPEEVQRFLQALRVPYLGVQHLPQGSRGYSTTQTVRAHRGTAPWGYSTPTQPASTVSWQTPSGVPPGWYTQCTSKSGLAPPHREEGKRNAKQPPARDQGASSCTHSWWYTPRDSSQADPPGGPTQQVVHSQAQVQVDQLL